MKDGPTRDGPRRDEGHQNVLVHEGAEPDPGYDGNEKADERVKIVEPDKTPSPRAETEKEG